MEIAIVAIVCGLAYAAFEEWNRLFGSFANKEAQQKAATAKAAGAP